MLGTQTRNKNSKKSAKRMPFYLIRKSAVNMTRTGQWPAVGPALPRARAVAAPGLKTSLAECSAEPHRAEPGALGCAFPPEAGAAPISKTCSRACLAAAVLLPRAARARAGTETPPRACRSATQSRAQL